MHGSSLGITLILVMFMIIFNLVLIDYYLWSAEPCVENLGYDITNSSFGQQSLTTAEVQNRVKAEFFSCQAQLNNQFYPIIIIVNGVILLGIARGLIGFT